MTQDMNDRDAVADALRDHMNKWGPFASPRLADAAIRALAQRGVSRKRIEYHAELDRETRRDAVEAIAAWRKRAEAAERERDEALSRPDAAADHYRRMEAATYQRELAAQAEAAALRGLLNRVRSVLSNVYGCNSLLMDDIDNALAGSTEQQRQGEGT